MIIGVVVGGIATLTTILFSVTYFVCFHNRANENGHRPQTSDVPMPHPSKTKVLGTGGKKNLCYRKIKLN